MSPFGGTRHEPAFEVVQERLAEAGARRDQRRVARRHGDAFLEDGQLVRLEDRHRVGHRFQVVQQLDGAVAEPVRDDGCVRQPWHVGEPCHQAGNRSRDTDTDGVNLAHAGVIEKGRDDVVEAVEVERRVLAHHAGPWPLAVGLEEAHQGLGAPDVGGQQHRHIISALTLEAN